MKVEDQINQKLVTQTVEETFECFPRHHIGAAYGALTLACSPVISVTSVEYQAVAGTYTTLSTDNYTVHNRDKPGMISPVYHGTWPEHIYYPDSVKVTYTTGYGSAADVPQIFKNAMLKLIAQWHGKREDSVRKMPTDVEWILNINRVIPV